MPLSAALLVECERRLVVAPRRERAAADGGRPVSFAPRAVDAAPRGGWPDRVVAEGVAAGDSCPGPRWRREAGEVGMHPREVLDAAEPEMDRRILASRSLSRACYALRGVRTAARLPKGARRAL